MKYMESESFRRNIKRALIVTIVLSVAFYGAHFAWNVYLKKKMGAVEYERMKEFFRGYVTLTDEMRSPLTYPEEVLESAKMVSTQRNMLTTLMNSDDTRSLQKQIENGPPLTDEDYALLATELDPWEPFLDDFRELVDLPGYDVSATGYSQTPPVVVDALLIVHTGRLLSLQMELDRHRGLYDEAFERGRVAVTLAKHDEDAAIMEVLIGAVAINGLAQSCPALIADASDPAALQSFLDALLEDRNDVLPGLAEDMLFADILRWLRLISSQEKTMAIPEEGAKGDYFRLLIRYEIPRLGSYTKFDSVVDRFPFLLRFQMVQELYYQEGDFSFSSVRPRYSAAEARYDLLCLQIAQRIRELKSGTDSETERPEIASFFDKEPIDPFSEEPFLWDATRETFYSVGPDETDDRTEIAYDPTNGTISTGDIFLGRREEFEQ